MTAGRFAADGSAEGPGWRVRFDPRCPLLVAAIEAGGIALAGATTVRARVRLLGLGPALELDERDLECAPLGDADGVRRLAMRLRVLPGVRTRAQEVAVTVDDGGVSIPLDVALPRLPWAPEVALEVGLREAAGAEVVGGPGPLDRPGHAYAVEHAGHRLECRLDLEPWARPLVRVFAGGGVHGFRVRLGGDAPARARVTLRLGLGAGA